MRTGYTTGKQSEQEQEEEQEKEEGRGREKKAYTTVPYNRSVQPFCTTLTVVHLVQRAPRALAAAAAGARAADLPLAAVALPVALPPCPG